MPRHPFLEDLADDVVLTTNLLEQPVHGRAQVLQIVKTAGSLYASQGQGTPIRLPDGRMVIEYQAELLGGRKLEAIVIAAWNEGGQVTRLSILFAPLSSALAFALRLGELLPTSL